MAKKLILVIFLALVIFSAIYALWDKREYTTSSNQAYQAFQAGESLMKKLYYRDALPEYEKAARIDTNFAMAYQRMAEINSELGSKKTAQDYIEKAIALSPSITDREKLLIQISANIIDSSISSSDRLKLIEHYINKYPDDVNSYRFQAELYQAEYNYDLAIAEYEKLVKKDPGDALGYNMLGYLYYYNGNFDKSLEYIKKYSVIAGKEANPHDSYGEILSYLGNYDEAIKEFETAARIKPDLDFVLSHLGYVCREIGRFRDAIGYYERAKEFARNEKIAARAEEQVAYTTYLSGDKIAALSIINKLFEQHPEWYSVVGYRGIISAGAEQYDISYRCLAILDSMIIAARDKGETKVGINAIIINREMLAGKIYLMENNCAKAVEAYAKAESLATLPSVIMNRFLLGKSYICDGQLDKAEEALLLNLRDNPNHPYTLFSLADLYLKKGDIEKQKQYLLTYLSVMSGADEGVADVVEARRRLDLLEGKPSS